MSQPVPFAAVASPDGSGWALGLGDRQLLDPELAPGLASERAAELSAALAAPAAPIGRATVGELPALSGTLPELQAGESIRLAAALFADDRQFGLLAVRPRRARGHDRDAIDALVHEDGTTHAVEDPRLSVTLDASGAPLRVGLELWLPPAEEPAYDFPRRASGEVQGPPLELVLGELDVTAHRVRWRSRGEAGGGWFVRVGAR